MKKVITQTGLLLLIVFIASQSLLAQETFKVPSEYPTIQAGIDAAWDGDTVLIADGLYSGEGNNDIHYFGKRITIKSENGPEECKVEGKFYFSGGEDTFSILDGIKIYGSDQGGIEISYGSCPVIINCDLSGAANDNRSAVQVFYVGGGYFMNCRFSFNYCAAKYSSGAAINKTSSSPLYLMDCKFMFNKAGVGAGAIDGDNILISNCIFMYNECRYDVGSAIAGDNLLIEKTTFYHNGGGSRGAPGAISGSNMIIKDCTFDGNISTDDTPVYYSSILHVTNTQISNTIFINNESDYPTVSSGNSITNCTFYNNLSLHEAIITGCDITNSILYHNLPQEANNSTINYSLVWRGYPGVGNIDTIPFFVNPDTLDFRLHPNSPCIDSGDPTSPLDPDGTRADMGAIYFDQSQLHAYFSATPTSGYAPLTVSFTDLSNGDPTSWGWDFENDGTVDSYDQNPEFTYTEPGIYSVSLTISDGTDQSDTETKIDYITVISVEPAADFSADVTSGEYPLEVHFSDQSTQGLGIIDEWLWDFGDGNTSTLQNPVHIYETPGSYTVSLTVTDLNALSDTETKVDYIIVTLVVPTANFTADETSGDAPLEVNFTDLSTQGTGAIDEWHWDFGDGNNSSVQDTTHSYEIPGTYTVSLTVTDTYELSDIEIKTGYITVIPVAPTANFIADVTSGEEPLTVNFTDLSTGNPTSWEWDFQNDGTIDSNDPNPEWIYNAPGNYTISLTISNGTNQSDTETKMHYIIVTPPCPTANFTADVTSGEYPLEVHFSDQSTQGIAIIVEWLWDFGDGNTSTLQNPVYIYETPGSYTVSLTVKDLYYLSDKETKVDYISVSGGSLLNPPTNLLITEIGYATWEAPGGGASGTLSHHNGYIDNGIGTDTVASWICAARFDATDLATYYGSNLTEVKIHIRSADFSYIEARVYEGGSFGNPGTLVYAKDITSTVLIEDWTNHVLSTPVSLVAGNEYWIAYYIDATGNYPSSTDYGPVVSGKGDWMYYNEAWVEISTAYSLDYNWCIEGVVGGVENTGNEVIFTKNIFSQPPGSMHTSGMPEAVLNQRKQKYESPDNTRALLGYNIYLDGEYVDFTTNLFWQYTGLASGVSYTAGVSALYDEGESSIVEESFTYLQLAADFTADVTSGNAPLEVNFTDLSTGNPTIWEWDFENDGIVDSYVQNPEWIYTDPGTYTVSLTISNAKNEDTETKVNFIIVTPVGLTANFTADVTSGDAPLEVNFTDLSIQGTGTIDEWHWDFGDGNNSSVQNTTHSYETPGIYTVSLTVTDTYELSDIEIKTNYITVIPVAPTANFIADVTSGEAPLTVNFTDLSTQGTGTIDEWHWDFGDGNNSSVQNTTHSYETPGTYTVSLTVTDAYDLSDFKIKTDYITVFSSNIYFTPIWTSPYNPMTFYILEAAIDELPMQAGDEVGLFDIDPITGEEICVGAGVLVEELGGGNYLEFIASMDDGSNPGQANGFTPGNDIIYKLWNEEVGEIISIMANYPYPGYDEIYTSQGSAFVELNGVSSVEQCIGLTTGWNILSFRTMPENPNMLNIVQPLIDDDMLVKVLDESGGSIFHLPFPPPNGQWSNTIGNMENTEGYYLKVNNSGTLCVEGQPMETPLTIPLTTGWNIIGYPCEYAQNALDAVQALINAGVLTKVIDESGGSIFHLPFPPPNGQWSNTIGNFESGEGYYVKVTQNTSLVINCPADFTDTFNPNAKQLETSHFIPVYENNPYMPMHIALYPNDDILAGDEIGVFDGEFCVGAAVFDGNSENLIIITASMDDPTTEIIDGFVEESTITLLTWNSQTGREAELITETIAGNPIFEGLETFTGIVQGILTAISENQDVGIEYEFSPNPFDQSLNLSISLPSNGNLTIEVFNLMGQKMNFSYNSALQKGSQKISLDKLRLKKGTYLVDFTFSNESSVLHFSDKIIKN